MRILIVEDEKHLARIVAKALSKHGHETECVNEGVEGVEGVEGAELACREMFDLIILDLNLPGLDGISILNQLRQKGKLVRVMMLTASGEVENRVLGLNSGADDYLTKPFSMDELVARVEALGRRGATPTARDLLSVKDLQVEIHGRNVTRAGKKISLSPREFELLQVLMEEPGRVFSRTELCKRVWHCEHDCDTRRVEIFITRLRKKLDENFDSPLIQTVRGVGYAIQSS